MSILPAVSEAFTIADKTFTAGCVTSRSPHTMAWRLPYAVGVLLVLLVQCDVAAGFGSSTHNMSTAGESGPTCMKNGRRCLKGVSCVDHHCVCPPGSHGLGTIECVPEGNFLCTVSADPHVKSYGNAHVDIDLPCRYRLTRFVTSHRALQFPLGHCAVEVAATNELHRGFYYVHSVHIYIGLVDSGTQYKDVVEVRKYGTTDKKIYTYLADMDHTRIVWGTSAHETIQGLDLYPTFDTDNNFAMLSVPQCDTRVKFRAFRNDTRRQVLMPGISIMAPSDSFFVDGYGTYPYSVCGSTTDTNKLYSDRANELGLHSKALAAIYDILETPLPQIHTPMQAECDAAIAAFSQSTNKVDDLNFCGKILTDAKNRKCVLAMAGGIYQPIHIFNACLRYMKTAVLEDCQLVESAATSCGHAHWSGPILFCP
ncbi:uncharacterized protein LOC143279925 [Babylonia areolata]|uniref:uncharacterized protein LOC143279925 n=1 Tax=Babylonia areolata TaxID=304850 RepID=UPI003FD389ED